MAIGFGNDIFEKKRKLEKDIGKWIAFRSEKEAYVGKIISETESEITLNPHQGTEYTSNGIEHKIIEKPFSFPRHLAVTRQDTSREEIENYCKYNNQQNTKKISE